MRQEWLWEKGYTLYSGFSSVKYTVGSFRMTQGHPRMGKSWKVLGILSVIIVIWEISLYLMKQSTLQAAEVTRAQFFQYQASKITSDFHQVHDDVIVASGSAQQNYKSSLAEVQHIVFLKVHKAASTTVQGLMMRFGYVNNLEFVLPQTGNYFSRSLHNHRPIVAPFLGDHYDIFCVHCHYNHNIVSAIMPEDSVHIAIVREPWKLFASAFHYYKTVYKFQYLQTVSLLELVMHPDKYEPSELSYTRNSMARDFGFTPEHYWQYAIGSTSSSAHAYLDKVDKIFDLVMVAEWFDESLILMKRLLNWKLKNILYISKNVKHPETNLTSKDDLVNTFKERNKLDYLIYDHFRERFKTLLNKCGESLRKETDNFRRIVADVQDWCSGPQQGSYRVPGTPWNESFSVNANFCNLMDIGELPFINRLKRRKQKQKNRVKGD